MYIKAISHTRDARSYSRMLEAEDFHVALYWKDSTTNDDESAISRIDVTVTLSPGAENSKERTVLLVLTPEADHNWDQIYVMNEAGDTIQTIKL